jgi:hypothetical protein
MGVGDHRQLERARQPLLVGLALRRKREHRLDQGLEPESRPDLADEPGLTWTRVPELVRGAGGDEGDVAEPRLEGLPAEAESNGAVEHLEALCLRRVDVSGRDEAVRLHDRLHADELAPGLLRGLVENQHLTGDGVLEPVSWVDHRSPFGSGCVRDRVRVGLRGVVARPPDLGYLDGRIRALLRRK